MTKWEIIHAYRHLMQRGLAKAWACEHDGTVLVSRLGEDDEPVLWCMTCGESTVPTAMAYDLMRAQVREHDDSV